MHPLAWCLLWMLAHVASRVVVSPALELDEAEQALWSQTLAWGYGSQPPLYTWLQAGWFALLGPSVLALSSLKFMLLGLTLVLVPLTLALPYLPIAAALGFVPLPARVLGAVVLITLAYVGSAELLKRRFFARLERRSPTA